MRVKFLVDRSTAPPPRLGREPEPDPPPEFFAEADLEHVPGRGDDVVIYGVPYGVVGCVWDLEDIYSVRVILLPKSKLRGFGPAA